MIQFADHGKSVRLFGDDRSWLLDLSGYHVVPREKQGDDSTAPRLNAMRRPHPSASQGDDTRITFVNNTAGVIALFWIDTNGERERYGSIAPGERRVQQTFGGHVWLITNPDGATLAAFEARNEPAEAVIDAATEFFVKNLLGADAK